MVLCLWTAAQPNNSKLIIVRSHLEFRGGSCLFWVKTRCFLFLKHKRAQKLANGCFLLIMLNLTTTLQPCNLATLQPCNLETLQPCNPMNHGLCLGRKNEKKAAVDFYGLSLCGFYFNPFHLSVIYFHEKIVRSSGVEQWRLVPFAFLPSNIGSFSSACTHALIIVILDGGRRGVVGPTQYHVHQSGCRWHLCQLRHYLERGSFSG